jgi:hypothetical protein
MSSNLDRFEDGKFYVLPGEAIKHIVRITKLLYAETPREKMTGDKQRDMAQALHLSLDEAFDYDEVSS